MASIKKQLEPKEFKEIDLKKSAGILNDYAVRKNVATREGTCEKVPVNNSDIANKAYVDSVAGAPEGTAVLSTGEGGATKYLRENGDGTCSWQTPSAGGDVTAGANLTDETLVQGDGGAKGVKTTTVTAAEVAANTAKNTNVSTALSIGTRAATTLAITSDGGADDVVLPAASTTEAGLMTDQQFDELALAVTHYGNNTQAHTDYLLNSGTDIAVGPLTTTADVTLSGAAFIPNVCFGTAPNPGAASGYSIGSIYVQYTA